MPVQRSKFPFPANSPNQQAVFTVPAANGGINSSVFPTQLAPNESPEMRNFEVENGYLKPRGGVAVIGNALTNDRILGMHDSGVYYAQSGNPLGLYAFSDKTVYAKTWADSSNWAQKTGPDITTFDHTDTARFWSATNYLDSNQSTQANIVFFAKDPRYTPWYSFVVSDAGVDSYTTLQEFLDAGYQGGHLLATFDDRLIIGKTTSSGSTSQPRRLVWTARGDPFDFTNGGFEDLSGVRGEFTNLLVDNTRLLIYSTDELWEGVARRDAYAFDFNIISSKVGGPLPRTIAQTPIGPMWIGYNYEICWLRGREIVKLGRKIKKYLISKVQDDDVGAGANTLWAAYDAATNAYCIFYSDDDAQNLNANSCLKLYLHTIEQTGVDEADGIWTDHNFASAVGTFYCGIASLDNAGRAVGAEKDRDAYGSWRAILLGGQDKAYIWSPGQAYDDGTSFDAYWRSRPIPSSDDPFAQTAITDAWIEVENSFNTASLASLRISTDFGSTYASSTSFGIPTGGNQVVHIPIDGPAAHHSIVELKMASPAFDSNVKVRFGAIQLATRAQSGRNRG